MEFMKKEIIKSYGIFFIVIISQFITIPLFADIDKIGKIFFIALFAIIYLAFSQISYKEFFFSYYFLPFLLISLFLISFSILSIYPFWSFLQSLILLVFLIYFFLVVRKFHTNPNAYNYLINLILIGAVFSAVLGMYEFFTYSLFGKSNSMLIPYLLPPDSSSRIGSIYGQPNLYAAFLTVAILSFYWKYLHSLDSFSIKKQSIFRFIPLVLVSVVFFLTGSRSGFLSLFFILIYLFWMLSRGNYLSGDFQKKQEFYKISFFVFLSFFIAQIFIFNFSSGTLNRALNITGVSTEARFIFWTSAILMLIDNLFTGVGLGNYKFLMNSYGPKSYSVLGFVQYESMGSSSWAHNEFLQLSCEGGIFVSLILLVLLSIFFIKIFQILFSNKLKCSPKFLYGHLWLIPFVIQSMFSWTLRSPPLLFLFFTLLGGLISQYPLKKIAISPTLRALILCSSVVSLIIISLFFNQELKIGSFKKKLGVSVSPKVLSVSLKN